MLFTVKSFHLTYMTQRIKTTGKAHHICKLSMTKLINNFIYIVFNYKFILILSDMQSYFIHKDANVFFLLLAEVNYFLSKKLTTSWIRLTKECS